jgi:light-regulated signal transduction histidine kinase (bacteriophytochrome)
MVAARTDSLPSWLVGESIDLLSRVHPRQIHVERVDLTHLVRAIVEEMRGARADNHRDVTVVVQDNLSVVANARLMRTLFASLIDNAWKFTARTPHPRTRLARVSAAACSSLATMGSGLRCAKRRVSSVRSNVGIPASPRHSRSCTCKAVVSGRRVSRRRARSSSSRCPRHSCNAM